MHIVTDRLLPDEPCYGLFEGPKGSRWIQRLFVIRGDAIAKYETDMGAADLFPGIPPLLMPAEGEESVATMQWWGDMHRADQRWERRLAERKAESTLIADIVRQAEQIHHIINNRSSYGQHVAVQRIGYDRQERRRRRKENLV